MDLPELITSVLVPLLGVLGVIAAAWIANRHAELKRLEVIETQCRILAAVPPGTPAHVRDTLAESLERRVDEYGDWVASGRFRVAVNAAAVLIWFWVVVHFARRAYAAGYPEESSLADWTAFVASYSILGLLVALGIRSIIIALLSGGERTPTWFRQMGADFDRFLDRQVAKKWRRRDQG